MLTNDIVSFVQPAPVSFRGSEKSGSWKNFSYGSKLESIFSSPEPKAPGELIVW